MADKRTYRHRKTGLIGEYDPRVALAHPDLIEVEPGTKPLAYTPIPREAVDAYLASRADKSDEGTSSTTKKRSK
ncbi:hypothetical protein [Streptomyces sp. AC495_CC817]|uniref:hypothetical protein n=1 Tax=Streptomyces sp. AC495_CC817 TaxID=2823900 RepID=UPI001C26ABE7|nr:hypothetical protein [Streptomyces sp. AC495_CC817]